MIFGWGAPEWCLIALAFFALNSAVIAYSEGRKSGKAEAMREMDVTWKLVRHELGSGDIFYAKQLTNVVPMDKRRQRKAG